MFWDAFIIIDIQCANLLVIQVVCLLCTMYYVRLLEIIIRPAFECMNYNIPQSDYWIYKYDLHLIEWIVVFYAVHCTPCVAHVETSNFSNIIVWFDCISSLSSLSSLIYYIPKSTSFLYKDLDLTITSLGFHQFKTLSKQASTASRSLFPLISIATTKFEFE